jgi:hypothetical protein
MKPLKFIFKEIWAGGWLGRHKQCQVAQPLLNIGEKDEKFLGKDAQVAQTVSFYLVLHSCC